MNRRVVALAIAALVLSACESTPVITTDVTPGANFAAYKTFAWANAVPPAGMNPVSFERMRQGIEAALTSKGYAKGNPGDLTVILTVGAKDKTDINTWGRWGQNVDVYQYTEGKMSIDVFDTRTRQPLWHGAATKDIDPKRPDPAGIDAAVTSVMANFPSRG